MESQWEENEAEILCDEAYRRFKRYLEELAIGSPELLAVADAARLGDLNVRLKRLNNQVRETKSRRMKTRFQQEITIVTIRIALLREIIADRKVSLSGYGSFGVLGAYRQFCDTFREVGLADVYAVAQRIIKARVSQG